MTICVHADRERVVMVEVHFLDPQTWQVRAGWVNAEHIVVARPVRVDAALGPLCDACAKKVHGKLPPALAVRVVTGDRYLVLGDGRSPDGDAVRSARWIGAVRSRCQREHHLPFDAA